MLKRRFNILDGELGTHLKMSQKIIRYEITPYGILSIYRPSLQLALHEDICIPPAYIVVTVTFGYSDSFGIP